MKLTENKKVSFDEFSHTYLCGDKVLIGVTSLMKKHGLSADYDNIRPEVLAAAAARGTAIHKTIEKYDNGEVVAYADTYYDGKAVLTAEELKDNVKAYIALGINAISSEFLVSDNKTVATSIDKVMESEKEGYVDLGDIKSTSTLHIKALEWQLGIGKWLFEHQCKKIKVHKCWAIGIRGGKGVKKEINPVSAERVEALLAAELRGEIYREEEINPATLPVKLSEGCLVQFANCETQIAELKKAIKSLEEQEAAAKEEIYQYMIDNNLTSIPLSDGKITLRQPSQRVSIDSDSFRKDYPDVYARYTKTTEVKGGLTFKIN